VIQDKNPEIFVLLKIIVIVYGVLRALPISSTSYNWNIVERGRTLSTHNPNPVVKQFSKDLPKEKHLKMFKSTSSKVEIKLTTSLVIDRH
jgi:hypothetical protein